MGYLDEWLAGKGRLRASTRRSCSDPINLSLRPGLGHHWLDQLRDVHISALYEVTRQLGVEMTVEDPKPALVRLFEARSSNRPGGSARPRSNVRTPLFGPPSILR